MQKNNVRNFVYSFIFSVLAVWAVQKVFLHVPESKKTEPLKESQIKKISLFENRHDDTPYINTAELKQSSDDDINAFEISALSTPATEKTSENKETIALPTPLKINMPQKPIVSTNLSEASEIKLSPQEINETRQMRTHVESGIVYADISDTLQDAPEINTISKHNQNDSSDSIPLVETQDALFDKIDVLSSAKTSQVAMLEPNTLINSMQEPDVLEEEKNLAEADIKKNELGDMFDISQEEIDNPWVMAKGNKYAKNQAVIEEFSNKSEVIESSSSDDSEKKRENENADSFETENTLLKQTFSEPLLKEKQTDTKLAYQMIQNILIPIPQDILDDSDLTPDLTSSPKEKAISEAQIEQTKKKTLNNKDKESGLFKSISSWFSKNADEEANEEKAQTSKTESVKEISSKAESKAITNTETVVSEARPANPFDASSYEYKRPSTGPIVPAELRLSFQPNRAEISGQTLKWIYTFADNARDNDDVYVEVRIDGTGCYALQQKRLNLLSTILRARGVDYRKINTIFTSREPNSFIIRNIRLNNKKGNQQNTSKVPAYR